MVSFPLSGVVGAVGIGIDKKKVLAIVTTVLSFGLIALFFGFVFLVRLFQFYR